MQVLTIVSMLLVALVTATVADVELVVGVPPASPSGAAELERLFWAVSTPGTSEYLQFKTVAQLKAIIGAGEGTIEKAKSFLAAAGAHETVVSPLGDHVVGRFAAAEAALLTSTFGTFGPEEHKDPSFEFVLRRDLNKPQTFMSPKKQATAGAPGGEYAVNPVKRSFGIPTDLKASNDSTLQMVWGPGTFGYSASQLLAFKVQQCEGINMKKIKFDTANHGHEGDNYGEGNLDVSQISAYGMNVETIVSNTNTSSSTEEGNGFGQAMLDFLVEFPTRTTLPQVLSISLGSLSAASCQNLCEKAVAMGHSNADCQSYMQNQRQVCMYLSKQQTDKINTAFKVLALRGVTVFGSSGDGGSHWSFEPFPSGSALGRDLNKIGCATTSPVYPTGSPYVTSVGGIDFSGGGGSSNPVAWSGSGGGFTWQFPRPAHQDDAVSAYLSSTAGLPTSASFNSTNRAYPDISAVSVEGTSQSSPQVAGIFSLIMDHRLNSGLSPLGFLGPRIYQVASKYPGEAFTDITDGNSKTTCDQGFPATKGWDPVTGFGSPKWDGLLKHFGSDGMVNAL